MTLTGIKAFIKESNKIEGITRPPTQAEIDEFKRFIELSAITVADLEEFVAIYQPGARLRDKEGLNVRVGDHYPPLGGKNIRTDLIWLLADIQARILSPYQGHHKYETLHPFTDGNGRSGRMLWVWQMHRIYGKLPPLGFLHTWYYQSLAEGRK